METQVYQDIANLLRKGDEKAFEAIYDLFYGPLYYFTRRILNNDDEEAQEITADTFLKLWKLRENFETIQNIKSFLYITARNASINVVKQKKKYTRRNEEIGYFLLLDTNGPTAQEEIKAEVLKQVLCEVDNLPMQCRKIFKRSFINGEKNAKIAEDLGLTLQTVKNQKTRAIKLLKLTLARREWQFLLVLQLINHFFIAAI